MSEPMIRLLARIGDREIPLDLRHRDDGGYEVIACGDDRDFQVTGRGTVRYVVRDGRSVEVAAWRTDAAAWDVLLGGRLHAVHILDPLRSGAARVVAAAAAAASEVRAVMPGRVVAVLVAEGQDVATGQGLVVVEAMKMENEMTSPRAGRVSAVLARAGETVETGALLVTLE